MKNILIVVDMQNDFIDGALGTKEAVAIVPKVERKSEILTEKYFLQGIPMKRIIWKPRRGKIFRLSTVSVPQKAGRSGKNWMFSGRQLLLIKKPSAPQILPGN